MTELSARKHFGAKGDGTTDDTAALTAAFAAWSTLKNGAAIATSTLTIEPGIYRVTDTIEAGAAGGNLVGAEIIGRGATILMDGSANYGVSIALDDLVGSAQWWDIDIYGLAFQNCGFKINNGPNSAPYQQTYKIGLHQMSARDFDEHGFDIEAFEIQLNDLRAVGASDNVTGSAIKAYTSSGDIYGATTNRGKWGLEGQGDLKVHGGTFLTTANEAIYATTNGFLYVAGVHVESNWTVPGDATVRPAIRADGRSTIIYPHVQASDVGNITHGVRFYAATTAQLLGGFLGGASATDVDKFVYCDGSTGGSNIMLIGVDSYELRPTTTVKVGSFGGNPSPSELTASTPFTLSSVTETFSLNPTTATAADVGNFVATLARRRFGD